MAAPGRVIALLDHWRPERYPTTRLYERHFLGLVHIVTGDLFPACLNVTDEHGGIACRLHYRDSYPGEGHLYSVGKVMLSLAALGSPKKKRSKGPGWLRTLARRASGKLETASGVLLMHMDFFVDPARLRRRRADFVWRLGPGLPGEAWQKSAPPSAVPARRRPGVATFAGHSRVPPRLLVSDPAALRAGRDELFWRERCFREDGRSGAGERAAAPWFGFDSWRRGIQASHQLHNATALLGRYRQSAPSLDGAWAAVGAGTVCAGWSDLYYVPMRLAAAFGDLMHLYFWQRVFHEVAVPSILHILSGGSREEEVLDGCFGCCCCDLEPAIDPALVLGKQECAHRVDLRDARARSFMRAALLRA